MKAKVRETKKRDGMGGTVGSPRDVKARQEVSKCKNE